MIGRLLCSLGLHRCVTTHEGKRPGSTRSNAPSGASEFIHVYCYRPECQFHVTINTHDNKKSQHISGDGTRVV